MIPALLRQLLFGHTIPLATVRRLKHRGRVVDWQHVRATLLADPNAALLIQVHPSAVGPGCLCQIGDCELLPRYADYLARNDQIFMGDEFEFLAKESTRVCQHCGRTGKLLERIPYDELRDDPDLPADRIRATCTGIDWQTDKLPDPQR